MTKKYVRYICNHIIFTVIIWLCVFSSITTATVTHVFHGSTGCSSWYCWDHSYGEFIVYSEVWVSGYGSGSSGTRIYDNSGCVGSLLYEQLHAPIPPNTIYGHFSTYSDHTLSFSLLQTSSSSPAKQAGMDLYFYYGEDFYTISGNACGNGVITLTDMSDNVLDKHNTTENPNYSFDIMNTSQYKLIFCDRTYQFIVTGNIIEDNDLCDWQILHYVDDCANLLKNPCINIIVNDNYANPLIEDGASHTDLFMIGEDIQINDKLDVWIGTDQGEQFRTIYASISENYLYHSYKSWDLDVSVYDINTSAYINNAKVSIKQNCRINGYDLHTYGFTNQYGYIKTYDLSNQPYQVKVVKEGYNTFGYSTINAGFDAQHTNIPLSIYIQDSTKGDGNGTIGEPPNGGEGGGDDTVLPQTECSILWTNNDSKSITEINNTVGARLYFMASNCSTTLFIESRNINTHTWDIESSLGLSALQTGYAQVVPSDWTYPDTKRYRGRIYAYDCGCDASDDLKVWNSNDPNITVIINLSSNVMFRHKIGGSYINPNSPIHILSSASSNNTTLLNIELHLFNESIKVDEILYTFFDYYDSGSFNSIKWEPNYQFTEGYRYCVYMYSNNILVDFDTVYANATGDNPFNTGNALTIKVYDHNSIPLQYTTVYVESWGSLDTGATNEVTFTGLGDDTYEYRAIKSGYLDRGFSTVTLTADATVSYILDIIDTQHAIRDIRMSDGDIKTMLYPVIFFILILLLVGFLIDAVN